MHIVVNSHCVLMYHFDWKASTAVLYGDHSEPDAVILIIVCPRQDSFTRKLTCRSIGHFTLIQRAT